MHVDEKIKLAHTAQGEELWRLVRDTHPDVILNTTLNKNLTEEMAVFIARKKTAPADALGFLANDIRFKNSYKLKLAICKNSKSPQKITLSLLKFLRIFDLGDMTKDQCIPISTRLKIEYSLLEKIPSLASGIMIALAKRANSNIVIALMGKGDKKVLSTCLESPTLTEGHLCSLINKKNSKPITIKMIAENPKWSSRYTIKYALIRNFYTPMSFVARFIRSMKTADLKELYSDKTLPTSTRPFIFRELLDRDETVHIAKEETYELSDEDSSFKESPKE